MFWRLDLIKGSLKRLQSMSVARFVGVKRTRRGVSSRLRDRKGRSDGLLCTAILRSYSIGPLKYNNIQKNELKKYFQINDKKCQIVKEMVSSDKK